MRYTLLEMVQLILSAMDSDEVNSIDDTVESNQVTLILKSVFYDLATELGLPEHETLFELNASGSPSQPTLMTIPDNCVRVNWIKYDNKLDSETYKNYQPVDYMPFQDFLAQQVGLQGQSSGVGQMSVVQNGETFELMYATDRMPQTYTSLDDHQLFFDAYDISIDTTLAKAKTMCHGNVYPTFTLSNSFTPDISPSQFSLLINRAKVRAFAELKQVENKEAANETKKQKIIVQKQQRRTPDLPEVYKVPRYGRTDAGSFNIPRNLRNGS